MKKTICILMSLVFCLLAFVACGDDETEKITDSDASETSEIVTEKVRIFVQPENALKRPITGMTICYLDYIVDEPAFIDYVEAAVTPVIVQSPKDFVSFFETADAPGEISKGHALYDEMTLTEAGKDIYKNPDFYDSWNLIILSVREKNAETKHEIKSVAYNTDSCVFTVNATRDVVEEEGQATVRHYVFRVPKNEYTGVINSFKKVEK